MRVDGVNDDFSHLPCRQTSALLYSRLKLGIRLFPCPVIFALRVWSPSDWPRMPRDLLSLSMNWPYLADSGSGGRDVSKLSRPFNNAIKVLLDPINEEE